MAAFMAMSSWRGEFTDEYFAQPAPDPAQFGMPTEDDGARDDPLLSDRSWAVSSYRKLIGLGPSGSTLNWRLFGRLGRVAFLYRLLPPRPTFSQDMSPAEAEVMQRHVAYWQDLLDRDVAVAFGPVLDPENPWGLGLLDLEDEQAARATGDDDPAVASGTCSYELLPMQLIRAG